MKADTVRMDALDWAINMLALSDARMRGINLPGWDRLFSASGEREKRYGEALQQIRSALASLDADTLSPSAPTEREKASAWRPISEAPKDGTWIMAACPYVGVVKTQAIQIDGHWVWDIQSRLDVDPYAWQPWPLPPAPAAEKE